MVFVIETDAIEKTVLKKKYEETQIEWRIPDITMISEMKHIDSHYKSPPFFINDDAFILRLYPNSTLDKEFMRLFIKSNVEQEFSQEYNVRLKKLDGSVKHLVGGIPKKGKTWFDLGNIIRRSQLLEQKSELAPHDVLTIICRFKRELTDATETSSKTVPLKLIRLDELSENFKDLFDDKETCDVLLKVEDKEYKAHRSVLIARSSVFAAAFKYDTLERQTGVINIPDCDSDSFQEFLYYLYSGQLEELTYRKAQNLYYTSDKYDVKELKTFCIECLMQCLTVENVCEVAAFADKYDETQLYKTVQDFFIKNSFEILLTSEWGHFLKTDCRLGNKLLREMAKLHLKK